MFTPFPKFQKKKYSSDFSSSSFYSSKYSRKNFHLPEEFHSIDRYRVSAASSNRKKERERERCILATSHRYYTRRGELDVAASLTFQVIRIFQPLFNAIEDGFHSFLENRKKQFSKKQKRRQGLLRKGCAKIIDRSMLIRV